MSVQAEFFRKKCKEDQPNVQSNVLTVLPLSIKSKLSQVLRHCSWNFICGQLLTNERSGVVLQNLEEEKIETLTLFCFSHPSNQECWLSALNDSSHTLVKCKFCVYFSPTSGMSHLRLMRLSWYLHPPRQWKQKQRTAKGINCFTANQVSRNIKLMCQFHTFYSLPFFMKCQPSSLLLTTSALGVAGTKVCRQPFYKSVVCQEVTEISLMSGSVTELAMQVMSH